MSLTDLQSNYSKPGRVENLFVRPAHMEAVRVLDTVTALTDIGLEGDHYQNHGGSRQVIPCHRARTLITRSICNLAAPTMCRICARWMPALIDASDMSGV